MCHATHSGFYRQVVLVHQDCIVYCLHAYAIEHVTLGILFEQAYIPFKFAEHMSSSCPIFGENCHNCTIFVSNSRKNGYCFFKRVDNYLFSLSIVL